LQTVGSIQSAKELIEAANLPTFDVILTDMHLPDGDGLGFLEWIRENAFPYAVVLITGHGDEETAVAALKAGVDDYISKTPGYLKKLFGVLETAHHRYRAESARRSNVIRVLYVEHNLADIDLTRRHFARYSPHLHLEGISSSKECIQLMIDPVSREKFDVLLLDHRLQGLNALEVMKELTPYNLGIPMILVTGHGDEEIAVQALKLGVSDYVVKTSDYLFHLPSVIENAHNRNKLIKEQEALKESEERFRRLAENAQDIISRVTYSPAPHFEYISPAMQTVLGYAPETFYENPHFYLDIAHPDDREMIKRLFVGNGTPTQPSISRLKHADGRYIWVEQRNVPLLSDDGQLIAIESITRDITERKEAEQYNQRQMNRLSAMLTIDNAISASLDLNLTLNIVLEHVVSQLNVDASSVLLVNHLTQTMKLVIGRGFRHDPTKFFHMGLGDGFVGKAIRERRIIFTNDQRDFHDLANFNEEMMREGFVSAFWVPLISKGIVKAVLEVFSRKPIEADREWMDYLSMLASQTAIAVDNAELFHNLQRSNDELMMAYDSTLEGWVQALDMRDKETEGHSQRVANITTILAGRLGVRPSELEHIRRGALLHDIGKLGVPESILLKPGPLTDQEWVVMKKHCEFAGMLLKPIGYLRRTLVIPLHHHEKWDGTGYPGNLSGDGIPRAARIFAIVDVWDSLTSPRPYRDAWTKEDARTYIEGQNGTHFDPQVGEEFLRALDEGVFELD
jgi:PAS domain S-box-containing protein